jgi:hypothetical protein
MDFMDMAAGLPSKNCLFYFFAHGVGNECSILQAFFFRFEPLPVPQSKKKTLQKVASKKEE